MRSALESAPNLHASITALLSFVQTHGARAPVIIKAERDERYLGSASGGGSRGTLIPSHPRSGQAGGHVWRYLSHHRCHAFELRELRSAPRLHSYPIQSPVLEPAYPRRLEHRRSRDGRVRRGAAADEAGKRSVVP